MEAVTILLLIMSLIMVSMAGYMDTTGQEKIFITKEHMWLDGIYLLLLALIYEVVKHEK